jgi:hypothetical protein
MIVAAYGTKVASISGYNSHTVWVILGCIAGAGLVGGFINALMVKPGDFLALPNFSKAKNEVQLGFLGNMVIGVFAAVITWGLYGPLKDAVLLGANPGNSLPANLTVTALVGAALAGAGGTRVVTSTIDKNLLKRTAVIAAGKNKNSGLAEKIQNSPPTEALKAAMEAD